MENPIINVSEKIKPTPDEINLIFNLVLFHAGNKYIRITTLHYLRLVSKTWRDKIDEIQKRIDTVERIPSYHPLDLKYLAKFFPGLKKIKLWETDHLDVELLKTFKNLQILDISRCKIDPDVVKVLISQIPIVKTSKISLFKEFYIHERFVNRDKNTYHLTYYLRLEKIDGTFRYYQHTEMDNINPKDLLSIVGFKIKGVNITSICDTIIANNSQILKYIDICHMPSLSGIATAGLNGKYLAECIHLESICCRNISTTEKSTFIDNLVTLFDSNLNKMKKLEKYLIISPGEINNKLIVNKLDGTKTYDRATIDISECKIYDLPHFREQYIKNTNIITININLDEGNIILQKLNILLKEVGNITLMNVFFYSFHQKDRETHEMNEKIFWEFIKENKNLFIGYHSLHVIDIRKSMSLENYTPCDPIIPGYIKDCFHVIDRSYHMFLVRKDEAQ